MPLLLLACCSGGREGAGLNGASYKQFDKCVGIERKTDHRHGGLNNDELQLHQSGDIAVPVVGGDVWLDLGASAECRPQIIFRMRVPF